MYKRQSQQYGGFTVPSVDLLLEPYAIKTFDLFYEKYLSLGLDPETASKVAEGDVCLLYTSRCV